VYLVTYAQALFAKAEAAKLGWIPDGDVAAEANYKMAIEHSIRQWKNNDTTGYAAMMASAGMPYVAANGYEQIGNQRWVHLFMHGFEAWAEWRRTGFPAGLIKPDGKDVPLRQGYPQDEVFNNKTHYEDAVKRQFPGGDNLYGRLWWDK
jgi:hypothetical protein